MQLEKPLNSNSRMCMIIGFFLTLLIASPILADVPKPVIPEANGKECVRETSFMRRNHMELLKHRRDETMYNGIRTKIYSFQNCLTCHAVKDEQQNFVTFKDERHFCKSCHSYVAVKIDCFKCHLSTPSPKKEPLINHPNIDTGA